MQKAFIAIVFALALTSAVAVYTPTNYAKNCTAILADATDSNFTNPNTSQSGIGLVSLTTSGDLNVYANNITANGQNDSQTTWLGWFKKYEAKALTAGTNNTYSFTIGSRIFFANNYAVTLALANDSNNIPQLFAYQQQIGGGAPLPRVVVTTNKDANWTTVFLAQVIVGKNAYLVYESANNTVNISSLTIGGSAMGTSEAQLTKTFGSGLVAKWGEALSTSQIFVMWKEGDVLKDAVVDASKGSIVGSVNTVGGYDKAYTCEPFVTDKKAYGEFCTKANGADNQTFYLRANTSANLAAYATYNLTVSGSHTVYPYGPYIALTFLDTVANANTSTYYYEIWNLDTWTNFRNRTQYLTLNGTSKQVTYRVPSGGLYSLLFDQESNTAARTNIQLGMLLGGSYLTSVLGFLMTVIAGLLLF